MSFVDELRAATQETEAQWRKENEEGLRVARDVWRAALARVDVVSAKREMLRLATVSAKVNDETGERFWVYRLCVVTGIPVYLRATLEEEVVVYVQHQFGLCIAPKLVFDRNVNARPKEGEHMFVDLHWKMQY